jgi:hypothetical protein
MRNFSTDSGGRQPKSTAAGVAVLIAVALLLLFWPGAITTLTGLAHQPQLTAPDELPSAAARDDAMPLMLERDRIEIKVAEPTTLREFLDRKRLNKDNQVKQIVAQLGSSAPATPIAAGTTFRLSLTPGALDVPGTSNTTTTSHAPSPAPSTRSR